MLDVCLNTSTQAVEVEMKVADADIFAEQVSQLIILSVHHVVQKLCADCHANCYPCIWLASMLNI